MYSATWSIFVQLFMVIMVGVATGEKVKTNVDGHVTWHPTNIYLWYSVQVVRWFAVLALLGWRDHRDRLRVYHHPGDHAKSFARASELGRRRRWTKIKEEDEEVVVKRKRRRRWRSRWR